MYSYGEARSKIKLGQTDLNFFFLKNPTRLKKSNQNNSHPMKHSVTKHGDTKHDDIFHNQ